jgi:hypothetical protein
MLKVNYNWNNKFQMALEIFEKLCNWEYQLKNWNNKYNHKEVICRLQVKKNTKAKINCYLISHTVNY